MIEPLRILSYNVRYFGHALRGLASTRTGKRAIAGAIASLRPLPHIICLQEVETSSLRSTLAFRPERPEQTQLESFMSELERAFEELDRPFPYEAFYFRAHTNRIGTRTLSTMGLAVVVDTTQLRVEHHNAQEPHPITHHHVQRFKDRKQARICAHLRVIDRRGRPLHVFNTHLSLPTPFAKEFWTGSERMGYGGNQLHEARRLGEFVRGQASGEPLVVCGDFNSPPGSPVYRFLTEEAGLVGVQSALGQIRGRPREFPTAGFLSLRMHLDHLFCNSRVRWIDLDGTMSLGERRTPISAWRRPDH